MEKHRDTLLQRVMVVNFLLFAATVFAVLFVGGFDLEVESERYQFGVLTAALAGILLANFVMLRRRLDPLERLIASVEAIDPADPVGFRAPPEPELQLEEVNRLARSFAALLERIEAERKRSGRLVLRAQEEERKRLARDLHDEANQALAAVTLRLEALSQDATGELAAELAETKRLAGQAMEELIALARQLRPAALDDHGLVPALVGQVRRFREQTGIRADAETSGDLDGLDDDQQVAIYRVAQEALNNVARHSGARSVGLRLEGRDEAVELTVEDDGRGFRRNGSRRGLGLEGMAERARLIGGDLDVSSGDGRGTRIRLSLPRKGAPA